MAADADRSEEIAQRVSRAFELGEALDIQGGGSKRFYGRQPAGVALDVTAHRGIVHYEPTELVITARAGTPLEEIETTLANHGQMLAFEPPHFDGGATLGGAVAAGLSGPRRADYGAVRDMVLGVRCVNGCGEILRFGGEVMKNVAGYDISRLMAGAMGTLGVLLDVSLKVLPRPPAHHTLVLEDGPANLHARLERWRRAGTPLSATVHDGSHLFVRLSGQPAAVEHANRTIGGERLDNAPAFWASIRDHQHRFFRDKRPLWRIALPPGATLAIHHGETLMEWHGMLCWLHTEASAPEIRELAEERGGHATGFRGCDRAGSVFHPLPAGLMALHRRIKQAMDPGGILDPGRMYEAF